MEAIDNLRDHIIDKLLTINNKEYLAALYNLLEKRRINNKVILSKEQIKLLKMSEADIKNSKLIAHEDLDNVYHLSGITGKTQKN